MPGFRFVRPVVLCIVVACSSWPPFEYEGQQVVLATDVVDRVCVGTIDRLDRAVARMDDQFDLPQTDERLRVAVIDTKETWSQCSGLPACAKRVGRDRVVVLSPGAFERDLVHEMVHARLGTRRSGSVALFSEGIAVALSPALCPPDGSLPTAESLLAFSTGLQPDYTTYYVGGELVAWLLDTYGADRVLVFFATLQRPEALQRVPDAESVRASYRVHFGSELDDDLYTHFRTPGDLSAADFGCIAPEAPREAGRVHLGADLDCTSPRVQNDFLADDRVFVEWILSVPKTELGVSYRLLDKLPAGTWLTMKRCKCELADSESSVRWNDKTATGATADLQGGSYLVRWYGHLGSDVELDLEIEELPKE